MSADTHHMQIATAVSFAADTQAAAREVATHVQGTLAHGIDLAIAFASADHAANFGPLAEVLADELQPGCLLGCTAESLVHDNQEIEGRTALCLWAARLPGASLVPLHLQLKRTADGGAIVGWPDEPAADDAARGVRSLLLLADPFSFPTDQLLAQLAESQPGMRVFGGMASAARAPGENRLLFGGHAMESGAVGVLISGVPLRGVVSQGCRPIGRPMVVTKAHDNVILDLGGRPAMQQAIELFETLSAEEQQQMQSGLHVGQVINEYQDRFDRGDFLIRNVLGADPQAGAIAIGDNVRVGQTVQFHVRDAQTADEDLRALLLAARDTQPACVGGLLFTCNGRGTRLFGQPHHDAATVANYWPDLPLAGFFAAGEVGPIGNRSFLHGFTASLVLFG